MESQEPTSGNWTKRTYAYDASVIIVNYKTPDMLRRTLSSIFESKHGCELEVVVVDNASNDGSVEMICDDFPEARCIANSENLGHSKGCNQGMALAEGRFVFLLNSDTIMMSGAIEALVDYLDDHAQVGAVGPKVLNVDGSVQGTIKRFPTPMSAIFGRFSIFTRLFPNNRFSQKYLVYLKQDLTRPAAVDSASGAALMVRREAIEKAGPFDEAFFLYWNDVDWCRSIWEAGYEVHYVPASILKHEEHHGGSYSGLRQRLKTVVNFHLGAYRYYRKWQVPSFWHPAHLVAFVGLAFRAVLIMFTESVGWFATLFKPS